MWNVLPFWFGNLISLLLHNWEDVWFVNWKRLMDFAFSYMPLSSSSLFFYLLMYFFHFVFFFWPWGMQLYSLEWMPEEICMLTMFYVQTVRNYLICWCFLVDTTLFLILTWQVKFSSKLCIIAMTLPYWLLMTSLIGILFWDGESNRLRKFESWF